MKIQRIQVSNFRNFKNLDVRLGIHAVIVGENKVGKSNLLYALRLVLDPSLSDSARQLQMTDFWDGLEQPFETAPSISVSVDLEEFDDDENLLAILGMHLISENPMVARLTYCYEHVGGERDINVATNYKFSCYGGDRPNNGYGYEVRKRLPLDLLPALRDAEGDLATVRRSPLQPLISRVIGQIDRDELEEIASLVFEATKQVAGMPQIEQLANNISNRLLDMVGQNHGVDVALGITPTTPNQLLRTIRILIDGSRRGIGDASLGTANLLFIALKSLELQQLVDENARDHTFLAIEEPEAHLHPHIQRLAYRDFLKPREHQGRPEQTADTNRTILLTTHSPHIVSVSPLRSLVLLRRNTSNSTTEAVSVANASLETNEVADLERYLDVSRGEIIFARGVILVEGEAELYIVPEFARLLGLDLDKLGITVCSVAGTNFKPFVKLLGTQGLRIPYAVITDYDPPKNEGDISYGQRRVLDLLQVQLGRPIENAPYLAEQLAVAKSQGIFLNDHTLEVDLFYASRSAICNTLVELAPSQAVRMRVEGWNNPDSELSEDDVDRLLKDIERIGKGRFAQRLASHLTTDGCPAYIREAINYVANLCS